jgi:hypothetical protein
MFLPMPRQRLWREGKRARGQEGKRARGQEGKTSALSKKILVEIGEVQPVLIKIGEPLRFVPYDFHGIFCIYILI